MYILMGREESERDIRQERVVMYIARSGSQEASFGHRCMRLLRISCCLTRCRSLEWSVTGLLSGLNGNRNAFVVVV